MRITPVLVASTLCTFACGSGASATPPYPGLPDPETQTPAELLEFVTTSDVWPQHREPYLDRIRAEPDAFAPLIAEMLSLPEKLADWTVEAPDARSWSARQQFGAIHLTPLLGRKRAEPILLEFFTRARNLYDEVLPSYEPSLQAWRRLVDEFGPGSPELRGAELHEVRSLMDGFSGMMSNAVGAAATLDSDVFIEPAFELLLMDPPARTESWVHYLVQRSTEHPDLIPRLNSIMLDLTTDRDLSYRIAKALAPKLGFDPMDLLKEMDEERARLHREGLWPPTEPFHPRSIPPRDDPDTPPDPD